MTLLVGTTDFSGGVQLVPNSGGLFVVSNSDAGATYVAAETGTVTHLYIYANASSASSVQIGLYTLAGALVCKTGSVTIAGGWTSAAVLAAGSVTQGEQYRFGVVPDAGYFNVGYPTGAPTYATSDGPSGGALPDNLSEVTLTGRAFPKFTAYADGTVGGPAVPEISSVTPSTLTAGSNPVIAGSNFGAAQGTGTVKLSPTDNVADAAVEVQAITTWNDGDPGITLNGVTFPAGTSHGDTLYYFVTNDSSDTNAAGHPVTVSLQAVLPSITLYDIDGQTALPTPLNNVRWAWFDEFPDGSGAMTPVNSGTGLTITNGALSLTVNNSFLVSGEYGMLLLEEPVSGRRQAYRLQVV